MLASLITFAHLAMSALMMAANASGASLVVSRPSCASFSRHVGHGHDLRPPARRPWRRSAAGVPAGAIRPNQEIASKPGRPDSATVGRSGRTGERLSEVTASPRSWPSLHHRQDRADVLQRHRHAAADHVGEDRAAIGHVDDVDAGQALEQFAGDVLRRADAGRGVGQLAGLRLGERDQLGERSSPARRC